MAADLTAIRAALDEAHAQIADREVFAEDGALYAYDDDRCFRLGSGELDDVSHAVCVAIISLHNAAPAIRAALDELEALRAKIAEAKRLGRDACELAKAYADDAREYGGDTAAADAIAAALEAL